LKNCSDDNPCDEKKKAKDVKGKGGE